ncbi:unnamed protein product [Streptomyces laurentii]|uniref:Uncharacterized protein n=1 Tax=Streptomyces laurentii TaxID=39478 RepID=A0A160P0E5_STRLU|nr:unnamed protein product [Streptomyces laurentii]
MGGIAGAVGGAGGAAGACGGTGGAGGTLESGFGAPKPGGWLLGGWVISAVPLWI